MRNSFLLVTILLLPLLALAQKSDEHPKAEIFGGYSYLGSNVSFPGGWELQGTAYFTRHFGVTADFSGHYSSDETILANTFPSKERVYTYMFGPTYTYRRGKHAVFAHALFGGAHGSVDSTLPFTSTTIPFRQSSSAFAMAFGGGLDLGLTKHFAIRPAQIDYIYTKFNAGDGVVYGLGDFTDFKNHQNSFRYSGGVVFRF